MYARLAERRERHHLVLIRGVQEAEIFGDVLVQETERMRHVHLADAIDIGAAADRSTSSSPSRRGHRA